MNSCNDVMKLCTTSVSFTFKFFVICCIQEAVKDGEFRTRLDEQMAEMQLAVEEQELQKAAAVKQGESATDEVQRQCTCLLEVIIAWHCVETRLRLSHLYGMDRV